VPRAFDAGAASSVACESSSPKSVKNSQRHSVAPFLPALTVAVLSPPNVSSSCKMRSAIAIAPCTTKIMRGCAGKVISASFDSTSSQSRSVGRIVFSLNGQLDRRIGPSKRKPQTPAGVDTAGRAGNGFTPARWRC
jgi:hypothetical protein